jgi:predicted nucleic acid-binding protein
MAFAASSRQTVTSLVFDTTALSHFARAGRTDELRTAVAGDGPVLLEEVGIELAHGISTYPSLGSASAGGWLNQVRLTELSELAAFAKYKGELGGGPERNNGEAAVLAWVTVNGGMAIIDEAVARAIGNREGLRVQGSLWLLIRSLKAGLLDRATVESVVDDLISTGMRLPVSTGEAFFAWAYAEGLLP